MGTNRMNACKYEFKNDGDSKLCGIYSTVTIVIDDTDHRHLVILLRLSPVVAFWLSSTTTAVLREEASCSGGSFSSVWRHDELRDHTW